MEPLLNPPSKYKTPKLKTLPLREQPASRVIEYGPKCGVVELLAVMVGGARQIEVAEGLFAHFNFDLKTMFQADAVEIAAVMGVGRQAAARIKAIQAFGVRLQGMDADRPTISSPADAAALVQYEMSLLEQESLRVILLNTRNRVLEIVEVYQGSLNSSQVRVGELFKHAIRRNAAAIIVVHNHPSGDPAPSPDDVAITRSMVQAGKLLDVDVLDHLVIGQGRFISLKEQGLGFT